MDITIINRKLQSSTVQCYKISMIILIINMVLVIRVLGNEAFLRNCCVLYSIAGIKLK